MKLVIDISEETYKAIMKPFRPFKEQRTHKSVITEACIAIANGKPQEQKTGHWKKVTHYGITSSAYICECSECGDTVWVYFGTDRAWKYCPSCGAKMSEDKDV